jgi:orotidine-5'-phosphate decarboxylase
MTCDYLKSQHPHIALILDAKRGDIGHTNDGYVRFAFEYLKADAITLHPYMGREAIEPFLKIKEKGSIILCRTSNPGAGEIQDLSFENEFLYEIIARKVATEWNTQGNCMLVVGATYPAELAKIRSIVGEMTMLVPGVGAQGGDLQKTMQAGLTPSKKGIILTVSRSVIYAKDPQKEAEKIKNEINTYRAL